MRFLIHFLMISSLLVFNSDESEILKAMHATGVILFVISVEADIFLISKMRRLCPDNLDKYLRKSLLGKDLLAPIFHFSFLVSSKFRKSNIDKNLVKIGCIASISSIALLGVIVCAVFIPMIRNY